MARAACCACSVRPAGTRDGRALAKPPWPGCNMPVSKPYKIRKAVAWAIWVLRTHDGHNQSEEESLRSWLRRSAAGRAANRCAVPSGCWGCSHPSRQPQVTSILGWLREDTDEALREHSPPGSCRRRRDTWQAPCVQLDAAWRLMPDKRLHGNPRKPHSPRMHCVIRGQGRQG